MQDFDRVPIPAGAHRQVPVPDAELLARQARAGLLWSPGDGRLLGHRAGEPTDSIPCGVSESALLDCMIQSTDDRAARSRIEWVCDLSEDDDLSYRIVPPADFSETRLWPWEERPRFRKEGAATFKSAEQAKAIIDEVVASCASVILVWLGGDDETVKLTYSFDRAPGDGEATACTDIVWSPQTNAIREVMTRTFVVTLERASGPDYAMGMRVVSARPIAVSNNAWETRESLRDVFVWEVPRPTSSIYRLYNECRLDLSCPFEVRLYKYERGMDEACDRVEFRTTEADGDVNLISVAAWTYELTALTIRGDQIVESDFVRWFCGDEHAVTEVPARWIGLRSYAKAAARRLEHLEESEFQ